MPAVPAMACLIILMHQDLIIGGVGVHEAEARFVDVGVIDANSLFALFLFATITTLASHSKYETSSMKPADRSLSISTSMIATRSRAKLRLLCALACWQGSHAVCGR
ncbi:unnamed protein product [Prunus armeniaca]